MSFSVLITTAGLAALAIADAGGAAVSISEMAFGDGGGSAIIPNAAQTALTNEVHRRVINDIGVDAAYPNRVVVNCVIPQDIGGFSVREVGLILGDGTFFAVASYPETYKPTLAESAGRELYVRLILSVGNSANVSLVIDATMVMATVDHVTQAIIEHKEEINPHTQYAPIVHEHKINHKTYFLGAM